MNTSDHQWKKSTFVSAAHVVQRQRTSPRHGKRLTDVLPSNKIKINPTPVAIGAKTEQIKVVPITKDGQVKALRAVCACGCESTFDIQYGTGGNRDDMQTPGSDIPHSGGDDQRMHVHQENSAA